MSVSSDNLDLCVPGGQERRRDRRLAIQLPVECRTADQEGTALRAVTRNISTGGVQFEAELTNGWHDLQSRTLLSLRLTVPPGEGHFPYAGHVETLAEVIRCEAMAAEVDNGLTESDARTRGLPSRRTLIAARFTEPFRLSF